MSCVPNANGMCSLLLTATGVRLNVAAARSSHRTTAWFKFGKNGLDASSAGIYGSQGRDDFDRDDVEHVSEFFVQKYQERLFAMRCSRITSGC